MRNEGWRRAPASPFFGTGWEADVPGSTLDLPVVGTTISVIFYRIKGATGIAQARVDDSPPVKLDAWFDQTWGGYDACHLVARDLRPGKHLLHVRLLDEKDAGSTGHEFRLEAVLEAGLPSRRQNAQRGSSAMTPAMYSQIQSRIAGER